MFNLKQQNVEEELNNTIGLISEEQLDKNKVHLNSIKVHVDNKIQVQE